MVENLITKINDSCSPNESHYVSELVKKCPEIFSKPVVVCQPYETCGGKNGGEEEKLKCKTYL